jgi:hypothetical protein
MRRTENEIENLFENTLDMAHNEIEALLDSLGPIDQDRLMERLIGNAADFPKDNLL